MHLLYEDLFLFVGTSVLWWVGIILIIPAAPATAALNQIAYERVHGRRAAISDFWPALKSHFGHSWLIAALDLVGFAIIGTNLLFYAQSSALALHAVAIFWIVVLSWWSVGNLYLFPFLLGLEKPRPWLVFRSAMLLPFAKPGQTISLALFVISLTIISVPIVILLLLIWPAAVAVLSHTFFRDIMEELVPGQGKEANKTLS